MARTADLRETTVYPYFETWRPVSLVGCSHKSLWGPAVCPPFSFPVLCFPSPPVLLCLSNVRLVWVCFPAGRGWQVGLRLLLSWAQLHAIRTHLPPQFRSTGSPLSIRQIVQSSTWCLALACLRPCPVYLRLWKGLGLHSSGLLPLKSSSSLEAHCLNQFAPVPSHI